VAVNYTDLFEDIGEFLEPMNVLYAYATSTPWQQGGGYEAEITAQLQSNGRYDTLSGVTAMYDGLRDTFVAGIEQHAAFIDSRLVHRTTILEELPVTGDALPDVLAAIYRDMLANSQSINASVVSLTGFTRLRSPESTSDGILLVTKVLDGVTDPGSGQAANPYYAGIDSELARPSEEMYWTCTADSESDGVDEGAEQFEWIGQVANNGPYDWRTEGSGSGPTITVANDISILENGEFEDFTTANTPDDWTIIAGVAGTTIFKDVTAANVQRGGASLKLLGNGSTAHDIAQLVAEDIEPLRMYLVAAWIKSDLAAGETGALTIQFTGTNYSTVTETVEVQTVQISGTPTGGDYTLSINSPNIEQQTTAAIAHNATAATVQAALRLLKGLESVVCANTAGSPPDQTYSVTFHGVPGNVAQLTSTSSMTGGTPVITHATTTPGVAGERIQLPVAALAARAWGLCHFFWVAPAEIPDDLEIEIKVTGNLTNAKSIWIDGLVCAPVDYFGGIGSIIVAGASCTVATGSYKPFLRGDRFKLTASNVEGVFQSLFRRRYGVQMPSNNAAGETIADSLASD
jgi:hypothetical protein